MLSKKIIKLEEGSRVYHLTRKEFYRVFEVEYLDKLEFANYSVYNWIKKRCDRANKKGEIPNKQFYLAAYFAKELSTAYTPDITLKWINGTKEFGLITNEELKYNDFVGEYTGVIHKYRKIIDDKNPYCFEYLIGSEIKTPFTIDAREKGSLIRFVNHSYKPNLTPVAVYANGIVHIIFKANRRIEEGEELTYHYGPNYWTQREKPI